MQKKEKEGKEEEEFVQPLAVHAGITSTLGPDCLPTNLRGRSGATKPGFQSCTV